MSLAPAFDVVPFEELPARMDWRQGEHVTLIGPTGQGKTTLISELAKQRAYVFVLATKKRDDTLARFKGYRRMEVPQEWAERILIVPPFPRDPDKLFAEHRKVFRNALVTAYAQGSWCVIADDARYLCEQLRLSKELSLLWVQGRSLGVSLVTATQRPRHIPLLAYDQATHVFLWRDPDRQNVSRIAEISGTVDKRSIMERVPRLPKYQFIYVNTRTDQVVESKVVL